MLDIGRQLRHLDGMDLFIDQHGLVALFFLGFIAATLVPLGSEWLLVLLLTRGHDPALTVAVAAVGNTLGALTTWGVGWYGGTWLIERVLRIDGPSRLRAERFYQQYGLWSLLLAWLPILGDPLCLIGGLLRVRLWPFTLLVATGKLGRYALVALLTGTAQSVSGS